MEICQSIIVKDRRSAHCTEGTGRGVGVLSAPTPRVRQAKGSTSCKVPFHGVTLPFQVVLHLYLTSRQARVSLIALSLSFSDKTFLGYMSDIFYRVIFVETNRRDG